MNVNIPDVQPNGDQRPNNPNVIDTAVNDTINQDQQPQVVEEQVVEQVDNEGGHPAWQEILNVLPESLHGVVRPTLQDWDRGVQDKLASVRSEYEPFKDFIEQEVDAETLRQGLWLIDQLQTDPAKVAKEIIEAWNLQEQFNASQQPQSQVTQNNETPVGLDEDDPFSEFDITKHPDFIAMKQVVDGLQSETEAQKKAREEAEGLKAIEDQLSNLRNSYGEFDETYVLALMSQGYDGEKAVKQFKETVNQAAAQLAASNQQSAQKVIQPPVVLGSDGAGSGSPSNAINPGAMKPSDREQLVAELLRNRSQSS